MDICRQTALEHIPQHLAVFRARELHRDIGSGRGVKQCQNHNRQNRAHRAQSNQTETVLRSILVASDRGNAQAQCHNERNRHGTGCNTAGVKCNRKKILRNKDRQYKYQHIEHDQHLVQRNPKQDAEHCNHKEQSHTNGNSANQRGIRHAGNLICQNLQIRFGNCYDHADQEANHDNDPKFPGFRDGRTDSLTDRSHSSVSTQRKETHANDQQDGTNQKCQQNIRGNRRNCEAQDQNNHCDRQDRSQCFTNLFAQNHFGSS